jgi:hypothetical protein
MGLCGGWGSQIFLEVFKSLMCLLSPLEPLLLLEEFEEREHPYSES